MATKYNQYNMRQVGERIRLPSMAVAVTEKLKDDDSTMRWVQLSKFNKNKDEWENFSMFADDLDMLGLKIPELLAILKGGVGDESKGDQS